MKHDESDFTDSFTGDFINEEPVVFKGLTDGEIKSVFLISLFVGSPIGVLLGVLSGFPMLMIVFVFVIPMVVVYFLAGWMEKARRGKPAGYVEHSLHVWLVDNKLAKSNFICESMKWSLGRSGRGKVKKNEK